MRSFSRLSLHPGRPLGSVLRSPVSTAALFLVLVVTLPSGVPGIGLDRAPDRVLLQGPGSEEAVDESSVTLSWSESPRAEEYVVFVSRKALDGRSVKDLSADENVDRYTTTATSVRLGDLLSSDMGVHEYHWTVAARDEGGRVTLADSRSFRSRKLYHASSEPPPPVRESSRGAAAAPALQESGRILLGRDHRFDPLQGVPNPAPELTAGPLAPGERGGFLVQLSGPTQDGQLGEIETAGAAVQAYVPNYAFLVRMDDAARSRVEKLSFVRWVGAYEPAYKLSWLPQMSETSGVRSLSVLLFPDADLEAAETAFAGMGGTIEESGDSGRNKLIRVAIDMSRLAAVATRNDVAWIEPWVQPTVGNSDIQWVVQTNVTQDRRVWDMGIQGQDQVVHTLDSGIRTSHNQFRDAAVSIPTWGDYPTHRKVIAYHPATAGVLFGDHSGASFHGTHTAGTLMGDDSPHAGDARDGVALKAKIYFHDAGAASNAIFAPGDLNPVFQAAYDGNAGGAARISSNSWGGAVMGAYTIHAMTADQFLWDHKDMIVAFSTGNSGTPNSVGSPATSKNSVGSGATQNGALANTMMPLTSQGPTEDLRLKPTVLAPGMSISSASGANDTGYQSLTGTSMSCPAKSGAMTLMRQYCTDGWYPTGAAVPANAFTPSGALVKAMAVASTDNDMTGLPVPNNVTGWGRINIDNILYFPGDAQRLALIDEPDGVATGDFIEYEIRVDDTGTPLRIALVWYDIEGSPAASRQLVNDLNLTVTDPASLAYLGNVVVNGQSVTGGLPDSLNVEEVVRFDAPLVAGTYTLRVTGAHVPFSPQPFAIAVSGGLGGNNGLVRLDRTVYGREDLIQIRVEDLNAAGPVSVTLFSNTESGGEPVSLAGSDGVFTGSVPTTATPAVGSDGLLSVSHGDQILVTYDDADPAGTVQAAAEADFTGPVITGVRASAFDVRERITWVTDVGASSTVYYGTTPALGQEFSDPVLVEDHDAVLDGLLPETTYYFDVESSDHAGNTTRDDNGGMRYTFTTDANGDILLVVGDGSFSREEEYVVALENRGWNSSLLAGGVITDPVVGDRTTGLRSYTAVLWQVGQEQYPPFPDAARDSLTAYMDGGGRLAVWSHDVAWAFSDPGSGYYTAAREQWINDVLHINWLEDPLTWPLITGYAGDPISDGYETGLLYTPPRDGAAGDEISLVAGSGSGAYVWQNSDATIDNIAVRWENGASNGDSAGAVWGGTPSKVVTNCWEWTSIVDGDAAEDVLDKTLIWLIGRDHPDPEVIAPNGGEVFTGDSVSISWGETTHGGTSPAARAVHVSDNAGASWTLLSDSPGAPPYSWDVTGTANGTQYMVRVTLTDDGSPALAGRDASDAVFALDRVGGDAAGPVVVAGSITADPNPMDNRDPATLFARISEATTGGADVTAAEWSWGEAPAAAGSGTPMSGAFDAPSVDVSAVIPDHTVGPGEQRLWVRGRDADGNWGPAREQTFVVNGDEVLAVGNPAALAYALRQNAPNPFGASTEIQFALGADGDVELEIFSVTGRHVRTLASGRHPAGTHSVRWDGLDRTGRPVTTGVYLYRLRTDGYQSTRKMILTQ